MSAISANLSGRTAIVTGASTGNGRGIAIALASTGADGACARHMPRQASAWFTCLSQLSVST